MRYEQLQTKILTKLSFSLAIKISNAFLVKSVESSSLPPRIYALSHPCFHVQTHIRNHPRDHLWNLHIGRLTLLVDLAWINHLIVLVVGMSWKESRNGNSALPILTASNIPVVFQPLIMADDPDADVMWL